MDDYVVGADPVAKTTRDRVDGLLEPRVLERRDRPAAIADHMVVVVAVRERGLVSGGAVADLDSLHELQLVQQVQRPIHARQGGGSRTSAELLPDLLRGHAASLPGEEIDHRVAGAAGSYSVPAQGGPGVACPRPRRLAV